MSNLLVPLCFVLVACAHPQPADLAIRGVTVVDVTDGSLDSSQTVLVAGNRIVAVGSDDVVRVPGGAEVLDATGGYLIPGLWDAHVHSAASVGWHFPLYIAYGVTAVRNMHTGVDHPLDFVLSIKRRVAAGELLGPRFLANGAVVDGDPPVWPGSVVVRDAAEARKAVDRLVDGGADFIKVYDRLTRQAYFAIMKRAKERGIPVDGHLPPLVTPQEAAAAGQRTIEHTSGITMGCSNHAEAIRAEYARFVKRVGEGPADLEFFRLVRRAFDTRDPARCMQTVNAYREHGVTVVPTLVANAGIDARAFVNDSTRMNLLPAAVRNQWKSMFSAGADPVVALLGPVADKGFENVRLLHDAGVTILAGTDVGNPFLLPGLSLHRELEQLHRVGLSAIEALQAATLQPARVFGLDDSLGTIETGKLADLVLLDGNPLEAISNTQRIRAVVTDGRLFRRADLDELLAKAAAWERRADKPE